MFEIGKTYMRRDIHQQYGGQVLGRISTPVGCPYIMLFTTEPDLGTGYSDGWRSDRQVFHFLGEGQQEDQTFLRGNKAIRDHRENNKALFLFRHLDPEQVEFFGEVEYHSYHEHRTADAGETIRRMIVFELKPVGAGLDQLPTIKATFTFPRDFLWGAATAAHQVEGNNTNNDWWDWEQQGGGRVFGDQTSGAACEWWAGRAEEDIRRMQELNTNAHRLSIEWGRIEPREGQFSDSAINRYREILGALNDAGIQPMVTLHHFTNPLWMAHRGGWLHPDAPAWFARFAEKAVSVFSDLCTVWCTINEPNVYAAQGYYNGTWPPGVSNMGQYFRVLKNMLVAHGQAYRVIHECQPEAEVGLAKHIAIMIPRSKNPLDRQAARLIDHAFNGITLEALHSGRWRPLFQRREALADVAGTLDWIGLNYYARYAAGFRLKSFGLHYAAPTGSEKGPGEWGELYPAGIFESLRRLHRQFDLPIYITENGVPDEDDTRRPSWILQNLRQVWRAVNFNWKIRGYYFWSLMDNFEWAEGYDPRFRFGLYGVDFETQERTLRQSGRLYAEIARSNALTAEIAARYAPQIYNELYPGIDPAEFTL
nr:glycoside hydrolase family 1 protein [Anaerolineae bacterium]